MGESGMRGIKRLDRLGNAGRSGTGGFVFYGAVHRRVYSRQPAQRGGIRCAWRAGRDAARFAELAVNV